MKVTVIHKKSARKITEFETTNIAAITKFIDQVVADGTISKDNLMVVLDDL